MTSGHASENDHAGKYIPVSIQGILFGMRSLKKPLQKPTNTPRALAALPGPSLVVQGADGFHIKKK
jgi:hypothetical protein